jgi:hypothetical protein
VVIIALRSSHISEEVVKATERGEIALVTVSKVPPCIQQSSTQLLNSRQARAAQ